MTNLLRLRLSLCAVILTLTAMAHPGGARAQTALLNVSYDPTREFYQEINTAFAQAWRATSGSAVPITQSHGGSGKQARAVIDGLQADVVTLALAYDINAISRQAHLLPPNWQTRLPSNSCPYTSTIVFLVRAGNPKQIKDWDDLVRPGISVITPNPKTSGAARWGYLGAWAFARQKYGSDAKAREFMAALFKNVPVLDSGARGATTTFAQRGIGDVLISWENEAFLAQDKLGRGRFAIIVPPVSMLAEPPVAVIDAVVDRKGTRAVAQAYLTFLYSPRGQEIAARHYYRPQSAEVMTRLGSRFPTLTRISINDVMFGGWDAAQKKHFDEGGIFDQVVVAR